MAFLSRFASRFSGSGSLVWAATSDDGAYPTSRQLYQLSALSYKSSASKDMFTSLEKRLKSGSRHWRNISKALSVIKYLILHGSPSVLIWLSSQMGLLRQLLTFNASREENTKQIHDQTNLIIELVQSPEKRQAEKEAYDKTREQVRTSMGRSSLSRNTLEYVRSMDEERGAEEQHQWQEHSGRPSLSLGAITEE